MLLVPSLRERDKATEPTLVEAAAPAPLAPSKEDIDDARLWIGSRKDPEANKEMFDHFKEVGEKRVFAAMEAILLHPNKTSDVMNVYSALRDLKGDRRRFIEYAVRSLADADESVRNHAVELLGEIGGKAELSPVVALLADQFDSVVWRAARTLAKIGGARELLALDIWLQASVHRNDRVLRPRVQECRDRLEKRLSEHKGD